MLPIAAAALAIVVNLGGVTVSVSGSESGKGMLPKQPDASGQAYLWPSVRIYPNQRIVMNDDSIWIVKRSTTDSEGAITIEVRPNQTTSKNIKVVVGPADTNTNIWWADELFAPEPTGEPGEPTWEPDPGEPTIPIEPSPTPTEPTPIPEPGGQDPIPGL